LKFLTTSAAGVLSTVSYYDDMIISIFCGCT